MLLHATMTTATVLFLLLMAGACAAAPSPPTMPSRFIATFTNPSAPLQPSTGTWYYDFPSGRQRVDGGNQESCNRLKGNGEYCTTFLTESAFYVAFPFTKQCVKTAAPGLLSPDWLRRDNATWVGSERVGPRTCDVWLARGSSLNYWLQERVTGFACLVDDGGFNWTFSSFQAVPFIDANITTIPSYCK